MLLKHKLLKRDGYKYSKIHSIKVWGEKCSSFNKRNNLDGLDPEQQLRKVKLDSAETSQDCLPLGA